MQYDPI